MSVSVTTIVNNQIVRFAGVTPIDLATNVAGADIGLNDEATGATAIALSPDQAPVARLSALPADAGQPTSFDASASTVAFGKIASYVWDFGDGTTSTTTKAPTTIHTYTSPGTYSATVTETSSGGTSTKRVFTGQTVSRNGGSQARATTSVIVPAS